MQPKFWYIVHRNDNFVFEKMRFVNCLKLKHSILQQHEKQATKIFWCLTLFFIENGQKKHYSYIYDYYGPIVYGFLLNTSLSDKNFCEILEQIFVKVLSQTVSKPDTRISFLLWLIQITTESIREYLKANNRGFTLSVKNNSVLFIQFTDSVQIKR